MVAVAGDHGPELSQTVLRQRLELARSEVLKGAAAPGRHLELDEDAVAVAVVEDPAVLLPVDPGQNAVELFQIGVIMLDP